MRQKCCTIIAFLILTVTAHAQKHSADTALINASDTLPDLDYDELFSDLESFLDSLAQPRSYFLANISMGKGAFNFQSKTSAYLESSQKFTYSPTLGYYHKSGLGITTNAYVVNDQDKLNVYQFAVSPSYDYMANRNLAAGISYTRFFTKDSLSFYTSPLQNEVYAYFMYRKWWLRPSIALSYGWGSRSDFEKREDYITSILLRPTGYTRINTTESIRDFSIVASVKHDFYWLDLLRYNDYIRFSPQVSFTSGTQQFGFNQTTNSYRGIRNETNPYKSENIQLDDHLEFQPLALSLFLRGEYSFGKFYIQPQLLFDYYFPAMENNFSSKFSLSVGAMF